MTHMRALSIVAFGACLGASPALAELTAKQVWQEWKSFGQSFGQEITGTETMDGNVLSVTDVTILMDTPEVKITGTLDALTFTERSDGSVAIGFPEVYPATIEMTPALGEPGSMTLVTKHTGLEVLASGTPGETEYDFTAESLNLTLRDARAEGTPVDMTMDFALTQIAGQYQMKAGALIKLFGGMTAASLAATLQAQDPENGTQVDWKTNADDLKVTLDYDLPEMADLTNFSAMLKAGTKASVIYDIGPMEYQMAVVENGETMQLQGAATAANLKVDADDSLRYRGSQTGVNLSISGSEIPLPQVTLAMAESAFDLLVPIGTSDAPQDFGLVTKIEGLSISEQLWSMFDPSGALPRDPATLVIDLAGKAKWLVDIFDPKVAETTPLAMANPGELHALKVNELKLSVMGADLTGSGDFTFDNTGAAAVPGLPQPEGTLNLKLVGARTLMGTLTQLGLLPPEQAMGAQMMLGMLARPGDGPDTLVSEITVGKDGTVMANGLPLPF